MFTKKRYFDKKWRQKWLLIDMIILVVCLVFTEMVWSLLGAPVVSDLLGVVWEWIKIAVQINGLREKLIFMLFLLLIVMVFAIVVGLTSLPIYGVYLGVRASKRRNEKQRVTYDVIQDIDYFREEFKGISPATISMLMNLKIETKKDITATLLALEQKNLIRIEDGVIRVYGGSREGLTRSESCLLELAEQGRLNGSGLRSWEQVSIKETGKLGFITFNKDKLRFLIRIVIYIGIMAMSVKGFWQGASWIDEASWRMDELLAPYEQEMNIDTTQMTFDQQIEYLEEQLAIPAVQEALVILAEMMMVLVYGLLMFVMPPVIVGATVGHLVTKPKYKRTRKGKLLTEQLAGMKKFIHDFSNLNEAQKEQLALWDEFLVYAVVLEENEAIVKEIGNIREVDLTKYRVTE